MALDIGIMKVEYLPRPRGVVYDFAREMAAEGAMVAYMPGEGNSEDTVHPAPGAVDARHVHPRAQADADSSGWRCVPGSSRCRGSASRTPSRLRAVIPTRRTTTTDGVIELHFNW